MVGGGSVCGDWGVFAMVFDFNEVIRPPNPPPPHFLTAPSAAAEKKYQCYYPQRSRDSLSPVCGICNLLLTFLYNWKLYGWELHIGSLHNELLGNYVDY